MGAVHAGSITLMVQNMRLVEDVISVMAGQLDSTTREEIRDYVN